MSTGRFPSEMMLLNQTVTARKLISACIVKTNVRGACKFNIISCTFKTITTNYFAKSDLYLTDCLVLSNMFDNNENKICQRRYEVAL